VECKGSHLLLSGHWSDPDPEGRHGALPSKTSQYSLSLVNLFFKSSNMYINGMMTVTDPFPEIE
jgi:hypothetical protein